MSKVERDDPGYIEPCPSCHGTGLERGLAGDSVCQTCNGNRFIRYWTMYGPTGGGADE